MKNIIKFKHNEKTIYDAFNVTDKEYEQMNKAITIAFLSSEKERLSEIAEVVINSIPFTMRPEHLFLLGYNFEQLKEKLKGLAATNSKAEKEARTNEDDSSEDDTVMSRLKELLS